MASVVKSSAANFENCRPLSNICKDTITAKVHTYIVPQDEPTSFLWHNFHRGGNFLVFFERRTDIKLRPADDGYKIMFNFAATTLSNQK